MTEVAAGVATVRYRGLSRRLAVAIAVGGTVVVYTLLRWPRINRFPPFVDEAIYGRWTRTVYEDSHRRFVALANGKEPLLTWAGAAVMKTGRGALTAQRVVSILAGVVTMAVVALIARELGGPRAAIVAAALYAVIPFFVVHDAIGIMEPLLTAATTTALYLQLRLARRPQVASGLALGLVLAAALLTKQSGLYALILMPAALLVFPWRMPGRRRRLSTWLAANVLAAALAWLGYSILRLSDLYSVLGPTRASIHMYRSPGEALARPWHWFRVAAPDFASALSQYTTLALSAAALLGAVVCYRRDRGAALLLVTWFAFPFGLAVLLALNAYPRYVLGVVPPLVPFAALGLLAVADGSRSPEQKRLRIVAAALLVVPALVADVRLLGDPARGRYPALDDVQFATGSAAGNAWVALDDELLRIRPQGALIAYDGNGSATPSLKIGDRGFVLVEGPSDGADRAPYVVDNGVAPPPSAVGELRPVWRYERPRDTPMVLLQRGYQVNGRFVISAVELRGR